MPETITPSNAGGEEQFKPDYSKAEQTFKREPIEDSPFWIIESDEKFAIVMGNARLTEWYHTKGAALEHMDTGNFLVAVVTCVTEWLRNEEKRRELTSNQLKLYENTEPEKTKEIEN